MEEKSLLLQFMGQNPITEIVDFLVENKGLDFSKTAIAEEVEMSRTTVLKYLPVLEHFGLVKITRRFGNTKLYTLNPENEITQRLLDLEHALIKESMESAIEEKAVSVAAV